MAQAARAFFPDVEGCGFEDARIGARGSFTLIKHDQNSPRQQLEFTSIKWQARVTDDSA